jgi:hypothetical protein
LIDAGKWTINGGDIEGIKSGYQIHVGHTEREGKFKAFALLKDTHQDDTNYMMHNLTAVSAQTTKWPVFIFMACSTHLKRYHRSSLGPIHMVMKPKLIPVDKNMN